jgi:hypothetical protein
MAGDGELDAAGEWIASAPEEVLLRLGAPRDRAGRARRPDATTLGRVLTAVGQCQCDDALCSWTAARARAQRPGLRRHLRVDGKAVRGAAPRGGRAPMLLSGIWDDGTTAAQRPVDVKTNLCRGRHKLVYAACRFMPGPWREPCDPARYTEVAECQGDRPPMRLPTTKQTR